MALDETAHAALRRLRTRSSPTAEDRARIKAKLAPFLLSVPLSDSALSSPASNSVQHGVATGPSLTTTTTTAETGVSTGGLVATMAAKIGGAVLCTVLAAAAWMGVAHWGASYRAPGSDGASQRITAPMASVVEGAETMDARSGSLSDSSASRETPQQEPELSTPAAIPDRTAVESSKPTRRASVVRSKSTGVPAREALQAEIEALRVAQEALRDGNPQVALRKLEQREKSAQLARDREGLRAVALCDANQGEAARVAAEQFLRRYSSSALARRVRSACAKYLVSSQPSNRRQ
ncbi:MAG TPA: hypothetical protein VKP30_33830 [Polyangiaceae bacterium]|nr:hypothetical protein [Polyangiaceae bacterium]